jgi:PKD repeat protein
MNGIVPAFELSPADGSNIIGCVRNDGKFQEYIMKNRNVISIVLLCIIAMAVLAAPVAGGLTITDGAKITSPTGTTSPVITITAPDIPPVGIISINISNLNEYVDGGAFTTNNFMIEGDAAPNWTPVLDGNYLNLTLNDGATGIDSESITVTFTGAAGIPWIANSGGEKTVSLTASRSDETGDVPFSLVIDTGGLIIADGAPITLPYGITSAVITIAESDFPMDGIITIDASPLTPYIYYSPLTSNNVVITSDAAPATWTSSVDSLGMITLISTNNDTVVGQTITVTFTGANGNHWSLPPPGGELSIPLTVTRTDTGQTAILNITMTPMAPDSGGLIVTNESTITTPDGSASPIITIDGSDIPMGGTIIIEVPWLFTVVNSGTFTDENVIVTSDATTWTSNVSSVSGVDYSDFITLTSIGGPTAVGKNVTVTFSGAVNHWIADSGGEQPFPLTVARTDTSQTAIINFVINTTPPPPPPPILGPNFIGSPTSGIVPLSVAFTDLSTGSPTNWSWDFGDGSAASTEQNSTHLYSYAGSYTVTLYIENSTTNGLVSKTKYINVLNGEIGEANSSILGLTTSCGDPQTITVDTSILKYFVFSPDNLEIQLPSGDGFKTIIFYGSFSKVDNLITGNPTGVRLVSLNLAPTTGFSDTVGKMSSFTYIIDLPSYPCNAQLSTTIHEGAVTKYDNLLRRIADGNNAGVGGTAFTAIITKTNFPAGATAKINMSVDASWVTTLHGDPGILFIWRIADDETYGQILPTECSAPDPVTNLVYCEADSPLGLSTFGISSISQNNNPFQIIAFVATNVVNQAANAQSSPGSGSGSSTGTSVSTNAEPGSPSSEMQAGGLVVPTPVPPNKPAPLNQPAMTTNIGMAAWLLAMVQNNPIILVGVAGVIVVVGYFGWWKQRL